MSKPEAILAQQIAWANLPDPVTEFAAYVEKVEVWAATELGVSFVEDIEPQGRP